jgi:hypothetical protein
LVRNVNTKAYRPREVGVIQTDGFFLFSRASIQLIPIMTPQCALQLFHLASSDMNVGPLTK